jgi:iron complex outermembrane receptor protein
MFKIGKAPKQSEPLFRKAQDYVAKCFSEKRDALFHGTIEIFRECYVLVRAAFLLVAVAAGLVLSQPAAAESAGNEQKIDLMQMSIEELLSVEVYSASKFSQKITEAPSAVTIITAADIKSYGYRTLADILSSVRGIYTTYDRNYRYVGVRGFNRPGDYNSRILVLVDGYRINEPIYDTALAGTEFFLDIGLIERVEVVRGPGSSVYGSNAVFGVVNIITKRGGSYGGSEASASVASFGGIDGWLTYGRLFDNGAELLLSVTRNHSVGQDLFYPEFNDTARNLDADNARKIYGKLAYAGFTLAVAYSERVKGIPTAPYGTVFNDPRSQTTDAQTVLDLAYDRQVFERLRLSARMYYGGYTFDGRYPYDLPPVTLNKAEGRTQWWGAEGKLVGRYDRHKLVAGLEFQDNYRQDQKSYDVDTAVVYMDDKHSSERKALYLQDEFTLRKGLLVNVGARYDDYSTVGGTLNPRFALIYSPSESTSLKLLYGTAFRAPNAYELYFDDGVTSKANLNLMPEEITSYEFVAEHQLHPNFRLTASVYQNENRNLISQVVDPADGLLVFENISQAKTKGAEFEVERAWADDTRLRASYAWQITRDDIGVELDNSPRHLTKLNYSTPLFGNTLRSGVELQYMSSRKTLAGAAANGRLLANLTLLNSTLAKGLEISASIYNLFDKQYADPGRPEGQQDLIPQDGRSFRLKTTYRF